MITWMNCYCLLQGTAFSPRAVEERYTLTFDESCEPGTIGKTGRFKGVAQPFGSAKMALKCGDDGFADDQIIDSLARARSDLEGQGMTMTVTIDIAYQSQCNIELSPKHVASLARLGCPVCLSCFVETEKET